MKNVRDLVFVLFLLATSYWSKAQDFDVYPRLKDDNVQMPDLYENTLLNEYQILSRNIRMMDMPYSAIVPGYIHFKAKDYATGYALLGTRLLGYAGLLISSNNLKNIGVNIGDIPNLGSVYNTQKIMYFSSITLIASSYLFDWIHGKARLEKKQELIRYRYSIKLKMDNQVNLKSQSLLSPYLSFTYMF
jgi:hypothetical protein